MQLTLIFCIKLDQTSEYTKAPVCGGTVGVICGELQLRNEHGQTKSRKSLFTCDHDEEDITKFDHDHLAYTLKRKTESQDKKKNPEEIKKYLKRLPMKLTRIMFFT